MILSSPLPEIHPSLLSPSEDLSLQSGRIYLLSLSSSHRMRILSSLSPLIPQGIDPQDRERIQEIEEDIPSLLLGIPEDETSDSQREIRFLSSPRINSIIRIISLARKGKEYAELIAAEISLPIARIESL